MKRILGIGCAMLGWSAWGMAQAALVSLGEYNAVLVREGGGGLRNHVVCTEVVAGLPFFDDFANNANGYYPVCSRWTDNHAFVNDAMAYNPPTIGVATLDGLDPVGYPYSKFISPAIGYAADTLTSQLLDLSGYTPQSGVALSFYYQPQGLSDRPELGDSLYVECRDSNNNWVRIFETAGVDPSVSSLDVFSFLFQFIPIDQGVYLHDSFQFRFRNLASITGNNDHWHIDYVYLDANRTNTQYFPDVAFTHIPTSPLQGYTAMPWRHVHSGVWRAGYDMHTYNHFHGAGTMDRLYTLYDTDPLNLSPELLNVPVAAVTYGTSPNVDDEKQGVLSVSVAPFTPIAPTELLSTYTILNPTDFQNNPLFAQSDTARRRTVLDNYFAYDDGTAEHRIIAQNVGTTIAVEFTAQVADTLRGIYFHLPHFVNRDAELDYINVKVWLDSLQNEVFSRDIYRLRYVDGFNGLHFVELVDFADNKTPVALAAGQKFYIGWQQSSTTPVPVGYDRSSDATDKTFLHTGDKVWLPIDSALTPLLSGAIMIRPLVSPDSNYHVIPVRLTETPPMPVLTAYPNPTDGGLNLQLEGVAETADAQLYVHNALGQLVYAAAFRPQLDMAAWQAGLYCITVVLPDSEQRAILKVLKY